jgi:hypothetical protein
VLYHSKYAPVFLLLVCFLGQGPVLLPRLEPLLGFFYLFGLGGGLINFLPGLAFNLHPPISTSHIAGIAGMHHHTQALVPLLTPFYR